MQASSSGSAGHWSEMRQGRWAGRHVGNTKRTSSLCEAPDSLDSLSKPPPNPSISITLLNTGTEPGTQVEALVVFSSTVMKMVIRECWGFYSEFTDCLEGRGDSLESLKGH